MEISYRPSRPVGLNSMTRIRITEYTSIRYWLKSRSISGSRVSTEAEITDPVMEPIPPSTTMIRISTDRLKSYLEGSIIPV